MISVDLQHIQPMSGATVLDNCDITSADTHEQIKRVLDGRSVDVVLSDMAPASSGVKSLDHDCIVQLALSVLRLSAPLLIEVGIDMQTVCFLADRTIGRAYGTVYRLSVVCLSSVTFCIVAKRCVLAKKCLKE